MELAARGVLTLVDHAAPARLREAYLRLRARDPATDVIVDVRRLDELPLDSTAILALKPPLHHSSLDWLNLNRPVLSERRLNVVLWCEDDAAATLSFRAPDFFDWISVRVDCPPAPAAHAVADVKRAICARAKGIAWDGPGLEEALAAVRPGRPLRRVAVASYQSMIDALTSREPGWLFLEGIKTAFHLRRLRWAMAETGRRVIVFRQQLWETAPGWWTVDAWHASVVEAVHALTTAGGTGRLAALAGLDPYACEYARFALHRGIDAAHLEKLLASASDPRVALQDLARQSGWTAEEVLAQRSPTLLHFDDKRTILERTKAHHERDDEPILPELRARSLDSERWIALGMAAVDAGDFEVAIRWLSAASSSLPDDAGPLCIARLRVLLGRARRGAGDVASARLDFEAAGILAAGAGLASMIAESAISMTHSLLEMGEPLRARKHLEQAMITTADLGGQAEVPALLNTLATVLQAQGDVDEARRVLERALSMEQSATNDRRGLAVMLMTLGRVLAAQGDLEGALAHLERSLELTERFWGLFHPNRAAAERMLAEVELAAGDPHRANYLAVIALEIQRTTLGSDDHPDVADTFVVLARVSAAAGDLDGARALLERALATQQKVFGDDGQLAGATTRRELAKVLVAKGDLTGAIEQLERALATLRKIFERDDHPDIAVTLRELERLKGLQRELQRPD